MFPFQPIDLSKVSYAMVLDIVAPLLPGGTIALGWLYGHEAFWNNLHNDKTLKIFIAVFAIYVVGLVMVYVTALELGGIAFAVLIRQTEFHEPWRNAEWRKLASIFLGAELSPPTEEPPAVSPQQALPLMNAGNLSKAIDEDFEKRMAPHNFHLRWQRWYEMLKARFPMPPNPQQAFSNLYFSTLNAIGWAGLISASISTGHVGWLIWVACALTITVSHVFFALNLKQQQYADPSGDYLAAEMLKAIEARGVYADREDSAG